MRKDERREGEKERRRGGEEERRRGGEERGCSWLHTCAATAVICSLKMALLACMIRMYAGSENKH